MNSSSKNPLALQKELEKAANSPGVSVGRSVENNVQYPAVAQPLKTVQNESGHFNIVDATGQVVGTITSTIFGLAKNTAKAVGDVSKGVVDVVTGTVNNSVNTAERIANGVAKIGTGVATSAADIVQNVSKDIVNGTANVVNSAVETGTGVVKGVANMVHDASKDTISGTSGGIKKVLIHLEVLY